MRNLIIVFILLISLCGYSQERKTQVNVSKFYREGDLSFLHIEKEKYIIMQMIHFENEKSNEKEMILNGVEYRLKKVFKIKNLNSTSSIHSLEYWSSLNNDIILMDK
ncbi:hypothetical protein [Aquimarina sp. Aq78]|uniref:hypothetical protein n=1 Tax=Aquimarina sp. Aq78 TaxID=1191889 RepID=UPI000D0F19D5|nr:hypothetical protein [Aquimarina sp. Aq78]